MPEITYREAIRHALAEELERDANVVIMGEEVAQFNGAYKVTEGLLAKFGPKRIVDTPITEAGFIGTGIGASMLGLRPVMELMFWSFYSVAFDQILNNAANVRYMSGGLINCPIVIRGPANGGIIGVLCRAFDIVPFDSVLEEIEAEFDGKKPKANADAARLAYENATVGVA